MAEHMQDKSQEKKQLGKGLQSLLGGVDTSWVRNTGSDHSEGRAETSLLHHIPTELIDPNPEQPRKVFNHAEISDLSRSLRQDGVLQPLVVMKSSSAAGRYILIAGERRLRASKLAGLRTVPALLRDVSGNDRLRIALIENLQRSSLNAIEEARAYNALIREHGLTQEQCAEKVGKDRTTIANALRLLGLPGLVQEDLMSGRMSMGHARALASLEKEADILKARDIILKKELSVRKAEQLCRTVKKSGSGISGEGAVIRTDPDMEYIADSLRSYLRTKVRITGTSQRGKIEISYFSVAELERVLGLVNKRN